MTEYVNVRASETLDQGELVAFLKSRFAAAMRPVGRTTVEGTECVEVRVSSNSPEFEEIRRFIVARRKQGLHGLSDFIFPEVPSYCEVGKPMQPLLSSCDDKSADFLEFGRI